MVLVTSKSLLIRAGTPVVLAVLTGLLAACSHDLEYDFEPPIPCRTSGPVMETLFLIGDAGDPRLPKSGDELVDPVLRRLRDDVQSHLDVLGPERTGVAFLGDNIYPAGLVPDGHEDRARGERILEAQIGAVGSARGFFLLGNHDWDQGDEEQGWLRAKAQAEYLSARGPNISVNPPDTCPGPEVVHFGDHLKLIFVDVWSTGYRIDHPEGSQNACHPRAGEGRVARALDEVMGDTGDRRAVLLTHPPMVTTGPHGGYFPWREHVFPLRVFHRDLWIPLPFIGSIFPVARLMGVTDSDLVSGRYRNNVETAKKLFSPNHPTLVAAGHEHSLQVHLDPTGTFHAVSGAGSIDKVDYVRSLNSDLMSLAAPGYMRVESYGDGRLRLEVMAFDDEEQARVVFNTCIP